MQTDTKKLILHLLGDVHGSVQSIEEDVDALTSNFDQAELLTVLQYNNETLDDLIVSLEEVINSLSKLNSLTTGEDDEQ